MNRTILALRLVRVGFYIGGSIVLGIWLGYMVDRRLDTRFPLFLLLGLLLGLLVAGYGVYQMLIPLLNNRKGDSDQ